MSAPFSQNLFVTHRISIPESELEENFIRSSGLEMPWLAIPSALNKVS